MLPDGMHAIGLSDGEYLVPCCCCGLCRYVAEIVEKVRGIGTAISDRVHRLGYLTGNEGVNFSVALVLYRDFGDGAMQVRSVVIATTLLLFARCCGIEPRRRCCHRFFLLISAQILRR